MENSWLLLLAFTLLYAAAVALISKIVTGRRRPARKFPPGPKPWPIIGNFNLLGSIPHQSLHRLSQKYGEIMLLKFGKFPVVIASTPEMAEQFLKVHDAIFASRPTHAAGKHLSYDYSDVSFAPYGPYWRQGRMIYLSEFFNAKKLESFEHIRNEERRCFLSRLSLQYSLSSGKPVVLRDHITRLTLSTICRMVLTDKYFTESSAEDDDHQKSVADMDELREMINEWFLLVGAFNIGDWIPWLSSLDLQGYVKRMKTLRKKMDRFYDYVIDDHIVKRAAAGNVYEKKDFVDYLLQIADHEVELTRGCLKALIQNLVLGGTDTSATSVEWAIHEILKQPRIMKKAKEELDRVIGRERWVEENDMTHLPYIDAIIKETFRLHPLGTLLAPHYAIEDCNVAGYDISKGTMVLINSWSIGRDPNTWDEAHEFLPERFAGKDIAMTGGNFALLPFGSGRRRCSGYNLGLMIVRATLANLVHGFEMKLVEGMMPQDICMDEVFGLTTTPKHPLSIIMEPTLPPHLY